MQEVKNIAERIFSDLMNDSSLSNILLKTKIYASKKGDKELQEWVESELSGYENTPPSYRILDAGVKVNVHKGFQDITNFYYPIEMIKDAKIRERLAHLPIHCPISEIEEILCSSEPSNIKKEIPVNIWYHHMRHCIYGDIQRAYQFSTFASLKNIIVSVKSLLVDYFLKIDKDDSFNFAQLMKKEEKDIIVDNRTIYNAAVVNTGSGSIHAGNISNIVGDENTVSIEAKTGMKKIVDEIESLLQPTMTEDCQELIADIKKEIEVETPQPKFLKRCFHALKGVASDVTSAVVAGQITSLITQALALL